MNEAEDKHASHRPAWDLIPWVVAGRANEGERALVEAHAQDCEHCGNELAFQRLVQRAMRAEGKGAAGALPEAEAGLARLLRRVDTEVVIDAAAALATVSGQHGPAGAGLAPVATRARSDGAAGAANAPAASPSPNTLQRWLVAAVVVQAVGLAALTAAVLRPGAADAPFQTLSQPRSGNAPAALRWRITLADPAALPALQAELAPLGLALVAVSADGLLVDLATAPAAAPEVVRQQLRALPGVRSVNAAGDEQAR